MTKCCGYEKEKSAKMNARNEYAHMTASWMATAGIDSASRIVPRYLRRVPSMDNLIPILYLKGVSSREMSEALASIVGPGAAGLSATNIVRLKAQWEQDYQAWSAKSFQGNSYVYFWADGIHFNVRLEGERCCILVAIGADATGKELLAVSRGYRESKASWREILLDLKRRTMESGPKLAIGARRIDNNDGVGVTLLDGKLVHGDHPYPAQAHLTQVLVQPPLVDSLRGRRDGGVGQFIHLTARAMSDDRFHLGLDVPYAYRS